MTTTTDIVNLSHRLRDLEAQMQPTFACDCPGRCVLVQAVNRREFYDATAGQDVLRHHRREVPWPNLAELQAEHAVVTAERRAAYEAVKAQRSTR